MAMLPDFPLSLDVPQMRHHFIFEFDLTHPLEGGGVGTLPLALHGGCGHADFWLRHAVNAPCFQRAAIYALLTARFFQSGIDVFLPGLPPGRSEERRAGEEGRS